MKKQLLAMGLLTLAAHSLKSQVIIDTVSVGTGYANHKFYSLQNDEQGTQSKDNWDLAFETTGYTSAILANTQKPNFALYKAPYSMNNYGAVDTTGISGWPMLYNSDSTWTIGAFNRGANPSNPYDLGWGIYDINTHFVNGDSCYVVKLSATSYKKLKIVSLIGGVYTFEYSNINGASSQTATVAKSAYAGKNFAYFDMSANTALDREPVSASWDLLFGKYTAFIPTAYPVTGIMANKGVFVSQMNNVPNPGTYYSWPNNFSDNITTIGHDWKTVNINTGQYSIESDTVYFVLDKPGNLWKVRPMGFGGAANGNFIFSKEKLSPVAIANTKGDAFTGVVAYPNPSSGSSVNLLFTSAGQTGEVFVTVSDLTGKLMSSETVMVENGLNQHQLNTNGFSSGVYIIGLRAGSYVTTQKLIKQ